MEISWCFSSSEDVIPILCVQYNLNMKMHNLLCMYPSQELPRYEDAFQFSECLVLH